MDEQAEGVVTRHVYAQFIQAGGVLLFIASVLVYIIAEVCNITVWLLDVPDIEIDM